MSRSLPTAGSRTRLRWLLATLVVASAGASGAFAQTAGCQVTYTAPTWVGGNGFGASIDIRNTGPSINGWSLVFNFPNGQRIQNGWPVDFTQPAGSSTVTVSSNAEWNATLATNATFNVGFNGTFSGANNPPTSFTLNGTTCNGGGTQNTAPTVSVTAPTAGQSSRPERPASTWRQTPLIRAAQWFASIPCRRRAGQHRHRGSLRLHGDGSRGRQPFGHGDCRRQRQPGVEHDLHRGGVHDRRHRQYRAHGFADGADQLASLSRRAPPV